MTICYLHERPEYEKQVAEMMNIQFGLPSNRPAYEELISHALTADQLPQAAIALDGGELVGMAALIRIDLMSRQDLTPWLAGLVVHPAYRGHGLGGRLADKVIESARHMGYPHVYLYTTLEGYYEKLGWEFIGRSPEIDGSVEKVYRHSTEQV